MVYLADAQAQQAIFPGSSMTPANVKLTPEQRKAIESASGVKQRRDTLKAWRASGAGLSLPILITAHILERKIRRTNHHRE